MDSGSQFYVERAKSGRAACKGCKQKCENGELRIAKMVPSPYKEGENMKSWYHVDCLMIVFLKQRPTTKRIDSISEIENWSNISKEDQATVLDKINGMEKDYAEKHSGKVELKVLKNEVNIEHKNQEPCSSTAKSPIIEKIKASDDDNFHQFVKLCKRIAKVDAYTEKTAVVNNFFQKGTNKEKFTGDITLWCKLLLPQAVKRVYNLKSKQLVKLFSRILNTDHDDMLTDLEQGDIAETIEKFFDRSSKYKPASESTLTIQEVDEFLQQLCNLTKEEEQIYHFKTIIKRCTLDDMRMLIRLIKGDLRINAGPKHILEGVHPDAYSVFQTSRDIEMVMNRVLPQSGEVKNKDAIQKTVQAKLVLMTPVLPMLAEACKSVEMAMKKCPNGMFSEIKYDGERVQVHKKGKEFKYFSRALKPVMPHKVNHFKDYLPQAFPEGEDLVLDAEVLMIDVKTGKPLPFGSLGKHKQSEFSDAQVCLFVFDCLYYNGKVLMDVPISKRRQILQEHMVEVKNHVMFSEQEVIRKPGDLANMIAKVLKLGLEGLVLKDLESTYEPGKRHWLKVKKDYLFDGAMADTADLVVLGAWFGSGKKGGMMSVFLMGCYDERKKQWCTVTKVHTGHDDKTLEKLQEELGDRMIKISQDNNKIPSWFNCTKAMTPDFIAKDPKNQPVWEITGTEFTKANIHTADGISVRFPRVTRIRDDKTWDTSTNLEELKHLYKTSKEQTDVSLLSKLAETAKKSDGDSSNTSLNIDFQENSSAGPSNLSEYEPPQKKMKTSSNKIKTIDSYFTKPKKSDSKHSSDADLNSSTDSERSRKKKTSKEDESPRNDSDHSAKKKNTSMSFTKDHETKHHKRSEKKDNSPMEVDSLKEVSDGIDKDSPFKENASKDSPSKDSISTDSPSKDSPTRNSSCKDNTLSPTKYDKTKLQLLPENPLPDVFKDLKVAFYPDFISFSEQERRHFERHWIAYGGKVVKSLNASDVDYVVHKEDSVQLDTIKKLRNLSRSARHVTSKWIISCINERKIVNTKPFSVTLVS